MLDNPMIKVLYPSVGGISSEERAEQVADQFVACLLMPRPWLKRAWGSGIQDPRDLARLFDVSPAAMRVRLETTGLVQQEWRPHHDLFGEEEVA